MSILKNIKINPWLHNPLKVRQFIHCRPCLPKKVQN
jgi:hypothetical protein